MTPGIRPASPVSPRPGRAAGVATSVWSVLWATLWSTLGSTRLRPPDGRLRLPGHPVRPWRGRLVGGVCAGLERALGWNAWAFRAAFVLVAFLPAYAAFWLLMPPEGPDGEPGAGRIRDAVAWVLLLGLGVGAALLSVRELTGAGLPAAAAVPLGVLLGAVPPVLPWSPLLAWRALTVVELLVLVAAGWTGGRVFPLWPLPLAALPLLALVLVLVALRHPRPVAVCAGTVTILLGLVAALLPPPDAAHIPVAAAAVAGLLLAGDALHGRREIERRLARQVEQAGRDRDRRAVLEERARIARELHDVMAHHLTMIAIQAEAAPHKVTDLAEPLHTSFRVIRDAARDALTGTRAIVELLRTDELSTAERTTRSPTPGLADLDELIERIRQAGLDVAVVVHGIPGPLPLAVDVAAYRIVQEALSNTARHAPGASAEVTIGYRRSSLVVEITDSGTGSGPPAGAGGGTGNGLIGMQERVAALDGGFRAGPDDDGGFTVAVELPIRRGPHS